MRLCSFKYLLLLIINLRLGDFKRAQTKNWMALKFGGLLECAEKASIVGEMGKLIIEVCHDTLSFHQII